MDMIELARTIQAERERAIEAAARSRRLLAPDGSPAGVLEPAGWRRRWLRRTPVPQRPVSSGTLSR